MENKHTMTDQAKKELKIHMLTQLGTDFEHIAYKMSKFPNVANNLYDWEFLDIMAGGMGIYWDYLVDCMKKYASKEAVRAKCKEVVEGMTAIYEDRLDKPEIQLMSNPYVPELIKIAKNKHTSGNIEPQGIPAINPDNLPKKSGKRNPGVSNSEVPTPTETIIDTTDLNVAD